MGIDVDATESSQLTEIRIYVHHLHKAANVADDLKLIQAIVCRIIPNDEWFTSQWFAGAGDNLELPAVAVHGEMTLELTGDKGKTVLTITPSADSK